MTKSILDFLTALLGLPVKIVDAILALAAEFKAPVSDGSVFAITILVCAFIIALPLALDRGRSALSRVIIAYGLLSLICMIYLQMVTSYLSVFQISGVVYIRTTSSQDVADTFPASRLGSNSCDANEHKIFEYCSNIVGRVVKATYSISSANCGSGIQSLSVDSQRENCVNADAHLQGCGYDRLPFGINNCRGRGWLEFQVTVYGSVPKIHNEKLGRFEGAVRKNHPFTFAPSGAPLNQSQALIYTVNIKGPEGKDIILTSETPSEGDFSTSILPNGELQVTFAKVGA